MRARVTGTCRLRAPTLGDRLADVTDPFAPGWKARAAPVCGARPGAAAAGSTGASSSGVSVNGSWGE